RVERRVERQIVESQRADVDAVDGVVRRAVASTFDGHVLTAAAARGAKLRAAIERLRRHSRGQRRERQQSSAGDRQVVDLPLTDAWAVRRSGDQPTRLTLSETYARPSRMVGRDASPLRRIRPLTSEVVKPESSTRTL